LEQVLIEPITILVEPENIMQRNDALWYVSDGRVELRSAVAPLLREGEVRVRTHYSAISRGTERLIFRGRIPATEHERMRCPHQEGAFPFPVKYGYALVGEITEGPAHRIGQAVFVLHPHQSEICVPEAVAHAIPSGLPLRRATLAANMETALNIIWDAGVAPGDRVLVIGGGTVGMLAAAIAARSAGTRVTVVDINPTRAAVAEMLGAQFALPEAAPVDQDVVIHTSGAEDGLGLALRCAGTEANVVEASWYGDKKINLTLGEGFHSRRLRLISSQVGAVPSNRRARWSTSRRLEAALDLLRDNVFDSLLSDEISFAGASERLPDIFAENSPSLTTVLSYS
jgi:threonine dehydrogenase-like Zn-dependent dehydrogenase